jgi:hypothetical protein
MMKAIWLVGYVTAWDSLMEWVLRLVETGIDGQTRSSDVMAIDRSDDFGDLANLGLTLAEAKQALTQVRGMWSAHRPATTLCFGRTASRTAEVAT